MRNLVVVSHTVRAHVGGVKIFANAGPCPLVLEAWLTHYTHAPNQHVLPHQIWSL